MLKTDVNKRNETVLTDEWLGQIQIQEPSWYKWQTLSMPVALGYKLGTEWAKLHSRAQQEQCAEQQRCRIWDAALLYSSFVQVQGSDPERVKLGSSFLWLVLANMACLSDFFSEALGQHDPTLGNLISSHIRKPNVIMRQTSYERFSIRARLL